LQNDEGLLEKMERDNDDVTKKEKISGTWHEFAGTLKGE
jgi:hypothetical protein